MAERTTVTQVVQVGVESTEGTAVAANKKLPSISLSPMVKASGQKFAPLGSKFPTIHALGKEWGEASISGVPTYSELGYLLSSLLAYAAPVQNGATTAYTQTFTPSSTAEDTIKSLTIERGSAVQAEKMAGAVCTELTLTGDRDKIEMSGTMLGRALTTGITLTATPTAIEQIPILPDDVSIYLDTTSGGIGGTKLTRVLRWVLSIKNRYGPLWVVDAAQTSYAARIELPVDASIKLLMEADSAGIAHLTKLRSSATHFLRIDATSASLAGTALPYKLLADCAVQFDPNQPPPFSDEEGVYAMEYALDLVHDETWTKAITAALTNKVVTL